MSISAASGAGYVLRGLRLIVQPRLRRFVLIPLTINIAVFSAAIWYGVVMFETFLAWMQAQVPAWMEWLEWVLWPLFVLALLIVVFYGFTLVANLLAAPFNGLLAEQVELHLRGRPVSEGGGLSKAVAELVPTLIDEVRKLLYILLWAPPFLILFLIPGINIAAPVLWFLYTAWMLTFQYTDYPMGNHGLKLGQMRARLRRRRALALGFGATAAGMTMVPLLNFLVMPSAVAGATAMWVDILAHDEE